MTTSRLFCLFGKIAMCEMWPVSQITSQIYTIFRHHAPLSVPQTCNYPLDLSVLTCYHDHNVTTYFKWSMRASKCMLHKLLAATMLKIWWYGPGSEFDILQEYLISLLKVRFNCWTIWKQHKIITGHLHYTCYTVQKQTSVMESKTFFSLIFSYIWIKKKQTKTSIFEKQTMFCILISQTLCS